MLETLRKIVPTDEVKMGDTGSQSAGKTSLAWLGGFLDGEGCLLLQAVQPHHGKHCYVPQVSICNTDKPTIEHISSILKDHAVGHHVGAQSLRRTRSNGHKDQWRIMIAGQKRCARFLELLSPYLVTKQRQAEVMTEFISLRMSVPKNTPYGDDEHRLRQLLADLKR